MHSVSRYLLWGLAPVHFRSISTEVPQVEEIVVGDTEQIRASLETLALPSERDWYEVFVAVPGAIREPDRIEGTKGRLTISLINGAGDYLFHCDPAELDNARFAVETMMDANASARFVFHSVEPLAFDAVWALMALAQPHYKHGTVKNQVVRWVFPEAFTMDRVYDGPNMQILDQLDV